jgi:hypothetical protein
MILFAWIGLLITIFGDIFRDHELSGWAKALWSLFLIVVPWLGTLVYLIARGPSMNRRARAQAQENVRDFDQYVRETAASTSTGTADELAKLAELRDRGQSRLRTSSEQRRRYWDSLYRPLRCNETSKRFPSRPDTVSAAPGSRPARPSAHLPTSARGGRGRPAADTLAWPGKERHQPPLFAGPSRVSGWPA